MSDQEVGKKTGSNMILHILSRIFSPIIRLIKWIIYIPKRLVNWILNIPQNFRSAIKDLKHEMDSLSWFQLIMVLGIFIIFLVIPLLSVAYTAFFVNGVPSLYWFSSIFNNPIHWKIQIVPTSTFPFFAITNTFVGNIFELRGDQLIITGINMGTILNSLVLGFMTTVISTFLGVVLAFIMARYDFFGKSVVRTLLIFPLLSTPFVGAMGVKRLIGPFGSLSLLFVDVLHIFPIKIVLDGLAAIIFVQSFTFFSLVYLNAYSSFVGIDPSLEEQAENLGAKGFKLFRTVTLPLALPGIEAGAILTFILSIEDLGTPIIFEGHPQAKALLTYQIFTQIFTPIGNIDPRATSLGFILLFIAIIAFMAIRKYTSLRHYASISKGGQWHPRVTKVSRMKTLALYAFIIPLLFLALIPQIGVILLSVAKEWSTSAVIPEIMTLDNYLVLVTDPRIYMPIINTILYGMAATVIIVFLGTSAAYIIARKNIPGKNWLDILVTMPIAIPGIVIALGYFTTFLNTPLSPLINIVPLLVMSYTIRKFPFTVRAAYAGLLQTHVTLEEASLNLGATRGRTFLKITLPLIGVSVLAGSLLSFVYAISEVSTSLVLGDVNPDLAPITWQIKDLYQSLSGGPYIAAVLGVLMMVIQMIIISITNAILKQRASAMTGI